MVVRARTAAEAQALGELCGNIMALATAAYVTWSTVVAFTGGAIPFTRLRVNGGPGLGFLPGIIVDQHFLKRNRVNRHRVLARVKGRVMLGVIWPRFRAARVLRD